MLETLETLDILKTLETFETLETIENLKKPKTLENLKNIKKLEDVGIYYLCCAQRGEIFILNCGFQSLSEMTSVYAAGKSIPTPTDIIIKIMTNL